MSVLATPAAWPAILDSIRKRISQQQFSTWFQNLRAVSEQDDRLDIRVPHQFFKEWLQQNYLGVIRESIAEVTGQEAAIHFVVDETLRRAPEPDEFLAPTPALARTLGFQLNDQYTFDTFVVGSSNQLAHAAAIAVSDSPGKSYNPFFVYGSVGLGKSHLLQAICHALVAKNPGARIAYLSCETFVNDFISAIQKNDLPAFRERHRRLDLLLIDDIQFLSRAEKSQEEFFHTFNDLHNAQRQIVLSSDQPPQEFTGMQERLVSRFKSGLVARIDPPNFEMRVAILQKKSELRGVSVPPDVVHYIANIITSNIRELDGAVTKILGYASLLNRPITLELARTALQEPVTPKAPITIEDILRVITSHYAIRASDIQSKKRLRSIVLPRQICMYLARQMTLLTLEEIGGYFGGRDHTTVLHAEDRIRSQIKQDPTFAVTIEKLKATVMSSSGGRPAHSGA